MALINCRTGISDEFGGTSAILKSPRGKKKSQEKGGSLNRFVREQELQRIQEENFHLVSRIKNTSSIFSKSKFFEDDRLRKQ